MNAADPIMFDDLSSGERAASPDPHDTNPQVGQCCNYASRLAYGDCRYCGRKRPGTAERPSQPEPDEVESAMAAAIVGELGQMMLTTGLRLPLDWAPRLAKAAKQASDAAVLRYLEREEPSAYEVRAGEARPGAADPDWQKIAVHTVLPLEVLIASEKSDGPIRDIGPSLRAMIHEAVSLVRGALSGGAAPPTDS